MTHPVLLCPVDDVLEVLIIPVVDDHVLEGTAHDVLCLKHRPWGLLNTGALYETGEL